MNTAILLLNAKASNEDDQRPSGTSLTCLQQMQETTTQSELGTRHRIKKEFKIYKMPLAGGVRHQIMQSLLVSETLKACVCTR